MKISLVIPVYNEQAVVAEVLAKYIADLKMISAEDSVTDYEIVIVNDGCSDGSVKILSEAARLNRAIRIINFDTRYGKQAAITAGMAEASGDCVILADIDILNPVGILKRVYAEYMEGEQIVYAYRERIGFDRLEDKFSNMFTRFAAGLYGVSGSYTGRPRVALYSRDVVDVMVEIPAKNKLLRTMDNWVDYEIKKIWYSSAYNKVEAREKAKANAKKSKSRGGDLPQRSKVREHTASLYYARAFLAISVMLVATGFVLLCLAAISFLYHFFLWVVIIGFALFAVMFYARAVLIKRVGLVRDYTVEPYKIKSVIN